MGQRKEYVALGGLDGWDDDEMGSEMGGGSGWLGYMASC